MRPALRLTAPFRFQLRQIRNNSSAAAIARTPAPEPEAVASPAEAPLNPRWLATQKQRIGKLLFHGATVEEQKQASVILQDLAENWRDYVAGAEGYLVGPTRRGLYRHAVAWGDMDSMVSHVNNVTYTRWAESARINWAQNIANFVDPSNSQKWAQLWTPKGLGLILRSIKVEYKFPMVFPDRVTVYHKLAQKGSDHFFLDVMILSEKHQRPAARCIEDIVVYDYVPQDPSKAPGKAPIPGFIEDVFNETARLQEAAKQDARRRMMEIENKVDMLEKVVLGREEM